jgi:hypothetical protein
MCASSLLFGFEEDVDDEFAKISEDFSSSTITEPNGRDAICRAKSLVNFKI